MRDRHPILVITTVKMDSRHQVSTCVKPTELSQVVAAPQSAVVASQLQQMQCPTAMPLASMSLGLCAQLRVPTLFTAKAVVSTHVQPMERGAVVTCAADDHASILRFLIMPPVADGFCGRY